MMMSGKGGGEGGGGVGGGVGGGIGGGNGGIGGGNGTSVIFTVVSYFPLHFLLVRHVHALSVSRAYA